ncbi:MAG: arginine--tRNA ligase [Candidatus Riflemargulisbacteria bacterium]
MADQKKILQRFGVVFDRWFSEKNELHADGLVATAVSYMTDKGLTYQQEGALFFRSTDFGDDKDRVLIKADGSYTYFAADIAYHKNKVDRGFNHLINIWGADHHGYIKRVKAAIFSIFGDKVELEVLLGQLVSLFRNGEEVRMSKRTGEMITLEEVIDDIGSDAGRFFLVSKPADTPLDFDLELAKKQSSDNPVFYVQYAHARICSILKSASISANIPIETSLEEIEYSLIRYLVHFEDELMIAVQNREPHRISNYLIELANMFHSFYHQCKVISDNKETTEYRLAIIAMVRKVLATGLGLLGVSAPEKM